MSPTIRRLGDHPRCHRIILEHLHKDQRQATHNLNQSSLPRDALRAPGEVTRVQSQSPVLGVTTSDTDLVDSLRRVELGHGRLTTELELSLLSAVVRGGLE